MSNNTERRYLTSQVEIRSNDNQTVVIEGYAARFDTASQLLGGWFYERISPRAFNKTINDGADVRAYFNHDKNMILGRRSNQTLRISVDDSGLYYEIDMPNTSYARDLSESIRRGDVNQSSFAFAAVDDAWSTGEDGNEVRTLREVKLYDVSPVTEPAYLDTTVGERSLERLAEARSLSSDELVLAQRRGELRQYVVDLKTLRNANKKADGRSENTFNRLELAKRKLSLLNG